MQAYCKTIYADLVMTAAAGWCTFDLMESLAVYRAGRSDYARMHAVQSRLQRTRAAGECEDCLILTEHEPVITLGRSHTEPNLRVSTEALSAAGVPVVQTERGGDITYHGPGQLVAYGIFDLRAAGIGAADYVSRLEGAAVQVAKQVGVTAVAGGRGRGVWVAGRKLASVGVNVRRSVTMHGIAINVAADLGHFGLINPCGMIDVEMTSLCLEAGRSMTVDEAGDAFADELALLFGRKCVFAPLPGDLGVPTRLSEGR